MKELLTTTALTVGYPLARNQTKTVAGPLHLALHAGELVCLLGPNGAGKSTLLRTLAGLQPAVAGDIRLADVPLAQLSPTALARQRSIVLTDRVETGKLTVRELVALGRYPHTGWLGQLSAHDHAQIDAALVATATHEFAARSFHQLSDGERQRVLLARALAQDTPLVLLDEPTAHLDLPHRVRLIRLLHQLARQTGKAILLSTHELDLALQAADRVWLLTAAGELHAGTPEDLVLSGTFEAVFAREDLAFDQTTGTFTLHQGEGRPVQLIGAPGPLAFWTRRALLRAGFAPTDAAGPTGFRIELRAGEKFSWLSYVYGIIRPHATIAELLLTLQAAD